MLFMKHIHHYVCLWEIPPPLVVSPSFIKPRFCHWFPNSLFAQPLACFNNLWFGEPPGTSASTKALTCSNFSAGSSWDFMEELWWALNLHEQSVGIQAAYIQCGGLNHQKECQGLRTASHPKDATPDSSFASSTTGTSEGYPEHGYQNRSFSKLADNTRWFLDVGNLVLHAWVYQWAWGKSHSWPNPFLVEASLEVKLPTIWTKVRRSEKKKKEKKEDAGARKGKKVAIHCVFPLICGSGVLKSRLAKAAGAEPSGQMRDEQLHTRCGAKHITKSQCTKHINAGPLLEDEIEMSQKCTLLWREANFEVKRAKKLTVRGIWGVRMSFCVAGVKGCTPGQKWAKHEGFVAVSTTTTSTTTISYTTQHDTTLNYITLHCTALHYTTPNYTTVHCTTLHSTTPNYTTVHCTTLHSTTLHFTTQHYTTPHCTTLHLPLHYTTPTTTTTTTLHFAATTLHHTTSRYTSLVTVHYTTVQSTTLLYSPVHYSPLHYPLLHYTTLHSITLNYTTRQSTSLPFTTLHYTTFNNT